MNIACERYWLIPTSQLKIADTSLLEGLYTTKILNAQHNSIFK